MPTLAAIDALSGQRIAGGALYAPARRRAAALEGLKPEQRLPSIG
jgi:hypothetical protein